MIQYHSSLLLTVIELFDAGDHLDFQKAQQRHCAWYRARHGHLSSLCKKQAAK